MSIRTTLTLDEDVSERARQFSKTRGIAFRAALNQLVRAGLDAESKPKPRSILRIKPRRMGVRKGLNYDSTGVLLELAEGPLHR
jgi:hypothetical protein